MTRISEAELERLFVQAHSSFILEDQFFAKLIDSTVYVHVPVSDDYQHVRFMQFRHPDGFDAIPFFTSALRSEKARSKAIRTLRLSCVDLFQVTRGATLMVNPNDGGAVIYPEEVASLLDGRAIETFEKVSLSNGPVDIRLAQAPPPALLETLRTGAALTPFIKDVYVLEQRAVQGSTQESTLLVYLGVAAIHMDRGARHIVSLIQQMSPRLNDIIDVAAFDADLKRPEFLDELQAEPVYRA